MSLRRTVPRAAVVAALVATVVGAARSASATERQLRVGVSLGYDGLLTTPTSTGFGGGVHVSYGVNDMFNVLAKVDVTAHPYGQWAIASGAVGAAYVVDIGDWTPWIGAAAGPAVLVSMDKACGLSLAEPCRELKLNLEIPAGLDYQLTKRFSIGLGGRFQVLLLGYNTFMSFGVFGRAEVVFGK